MGGVFRMKRIEDASGESLLPFVEECTDIKVVSRQEQSKSELMPRVDGYPVDTFRQVIAVAVQEDGRGIGRIRMKRIEDASGESLLPFVEECIAGQRGAYRGWPGYSGLKKEGYVHQVTVVSRQEQSASELMPRVHRVAPRCSMPADGRLPSEPDRAPRFEMEDYPF